MSRELSASALQIEEKRERMLAMLKLARELTEEIIENFKLENPQATESDVIQCVKDNPIKINAFLHEYIASLVEGKSVSLITARTYFDHYSKRIRKTFIEVSNEGAKMPYGFHLNDNLIRGSIVEVTRKLSKKARESS